MSEQATETVTNVTTEATETTEATVEATEQENAPQEGTQPEGDTFPRSYVEKLRRENAGYRERAQRADALSERLMAATVREATRGILADPTDLAVADSATLTDSDGYPDPVKVKAAAEELVARKPHLADRRPRGDIGQGATTEPEQVDLAGMLRARA